MEGELRSLELHFFRLFQLMCEYSLVGGGADENERSNQIFVVQVR